MRGLLPAMSLGGLLCLLPLNAAQTITVHVVNFDFTDGAGNHFDPTIQIGDTIHWVWDAGFHSSQSVAGSAESWDSGTHSAPFAFDHTFTKAGDFVYFCSVHGSDNGNGTASGMSGVIHVAPPPQNRYVRTNLVADTPGTATNTDPNLINGWGLDKAPNGPWWVNSAGRGLSLLYDGTGAVQPLVVTVPPAPPTPPPSSPTGIVYNSTTDFVLAPGSPAIFLFASEDGAISGWNPTVNPTTAVIKVNRSGSAIYKGLALGQINGRNVLYAANFFGTAIEVFDRNFNPVTLGASAFKDPAVPAGYGPFNIQRIAGRLYVTWAKQDANKEDDVPGPGFGYVSVFSPVGTLTGRLQHGNWMNAPWGIALAPSGFAALSNTLLVGQFGSGVIIAFDPATGRIRGPLRNTSNQPLVIQGLWGLSFGNGGPAGPATTLYFAAGPAGETHGLFGSIAPQ